MRSSLSAGEIFHIKKKMSNLTTSNGAPVDNNQTSITAGEHGPVYAPVQIDFIPLGSSRTFI
jgi:catalase